MTKKKSVDLLPQRSDAKAFGRGAPSQENLKKATVALEDLVMLLRHIKTENLLYGVEALNSLVHSNAGSNRVSVVAKNYQSSDPNKHFLIGALPRLLLDKELFPSNDDIIDFAASALQIEMKVDKRARFEIIGKIVCETDALDEKRLTDLVRVLERLVGDKNAIAMMVEKRRAGSFSWNETLQDLFRR